MLTLAAEAWTQRFHAHAQKADALTQGYRERVQEGVPHAVDDFLYTYYNLRPARLRRWHPGVDVALHDVVQADATVTVAPHAQWRWYVHKNGATFLDRDAFMEERGEAV